MTADIAIEMPPVSSDSDRAAVSSDFELPPAQSFERCLLLYERNIYGSLAVKEGSLPMAFMVLLSQITIPISILITYYPNVTKFLDGNSRSDWGVCLVGSVLLSLLWNLILTDTRKSADSFDVVGGCTHLPRPYFVTLGLLLTEIVNPIAGVAAFFLLCKSESVEETALNTLAMFFVNRLDEDFAKAKTGVEIWKTMCCQCDDDSSSGLDWTLQEDDVESAKRYRERYGPWVYNSHLNGFVTIFALLTEFSSFILSLALPVVFFIYSMPS
mmetsp:Transcript_49258/g.96627  ORF Transcript_49258/g.96627 Transcript_49258/m.96627 type:complete len:270 (-) Transcript_49258:278-1087(-)|eukprot:CAMPEP_0175134142 /NCGR_PEP_ID=MMETSP0087-20121206/8025_1 /TAXON_ID=136419 /ORGANISM="Unknown Unknown, Strain D1" /LENGTH=269 /DNA_ID=CAMNT_0016416693 /DNA_START=25 /DNA_END=834 /DNA_ORIENTATION=-